MKNISCFIFFLVTSFSSPHTFAVFTFPSTNANWVYQYFDEFQQPGPLVTYTMYGDTVISNRTYKRISGCSYAWGLCNIGSIRDSNNIVYFIPDTSATEFILYDFNLNIGDTFFNSYDQNLTGVNYAIVTDDDFVLASDGFHRRLYLTSGDHWIDGIGSESYLFLPTGFIGLSGKDVLQCLATDSGFIYGNSLCIASIHTPLDLKNIVSIYPNPFSTSTQLEFILFIQNGELRLFNSFGEMVRKEYISNATHYILDRNSLLGGLYLLELKFETGIIQKKVIIE